jgi:hypothetical protein
MTTLVYPYTPPRPSRRTHLHTISIFRCSSFCKVVYVYVAALAWTAPGRPSFDSPSIFALIAYSIIVFYIGPRRSFTTFPNFFSFHTCPSFGLASSRLLILNYVESE